MGNLFHSSASYNDSWILGNHYEGNSIDDLKRSQTIKSFFRFTYRYHMPPLLPSNITSDCGWGCMLRAAQMIMAYTLKCHYHLDINDLTVAASHLSTSDEYRNIVRWFIDYPGFPHLYSLHRMIECGLKYSMQPGEWYGPSTVSYVLRDLANTHCSHFGGTLKLLVTQGDTIYLSEVGKLCISVNYNSTSATSMVNCNHTSHLNSIAPISIQPISSSQEREFFYDPLIHPPPLSHYVSSPTVINSNGLDDNIITRLSLQQENQIIMNEDHCNQQNREGGAQGSTIISDQWTGDCGLMILIPLRLGINNVNEEYIEEIKEVLRDKHCVGILGGKPNHALYFVGYTTSATTATEDCSHNTYNQSNYFYDHSTAAKKCLKETNKCIEDECQKATPGTTSNARTSYHDHISVQTSAVVNGHKVQTQLLGFDPHTAYTNPPRPASYHSSNSQTTSVTTQQSNNGNRNMMMNQTINNNTNKVDNMNYSSFTNILNEKSLHSSISLSSQHKKKKKNERSTTASTVFPSPEYLKQIHTSQCSLVDIKQLDPSLAVGFYFRNKIEFDLFCMKYKEIEIKKLELGLSPLFSIREKMPSYMNSTVKLNKSNSDLSNKIETTTVVKETTVMKKDMVLMKSNLDIYSEMIGVDIVAPSRDKKYQIDQYDDSIDDISYPTTIFTRTSLLDACTNNVTMETTTHLNIHTKLVVSSNDHHNDSEDVDDDDNDEYVLV